MILASDKIIRESITNVELTLDLIKYLGWYTDSDKLGFKNEWTFFNTDYPYSHINYVCESERFVFVYVSEDLEKLTHKVVNTYNELEDALHDYRKR